MLFRWRLSLGEQAAHAVQCQSPRLAPATALRLARIHAGYRRQSRLAEMVGFPVRLINELEVGHRRPTPAQLAVLRVLLALR